MTYCVAIRMDAGLCFVSDSRTNAGVDNVSTYSKMFTFGQDNERLIVVLTAGNLATTQGVIGQIKKDVKQGSQTSLMTIPSLEDAADYLGAISLEQQQKHTGGGAKYEASFIVGGQISGQKHGAYLVYPQGNHITTSVDTSYLQIGESKYGKPILDRILTPELNLDTCAMCALVSMDSTMRSNLSVGPPIDVIVYPTDSLRIDRKYRFEESSEYLRQINKSWDARLKDAFSSMPPIAWSANWDQSNENT